MLENTYTRAKTTLFFVSRLSILAFMGLLPAFVFFVTGVHICSFITGYNFMSTFNWLNTYKEDSGALNAYKFLNAFSTIGLMVIPAWFFPQVLRQDSGTFIQSSRKFNPIHIGLAILTILACIPFVSWLIELNSHLQLSADLEAMHKSTAEMTKAFVSSSTSGELMINILVIAIIPAIAEEMLFRGALQQLIYYCFKNKHSAIISTAMIFSAFHMDLYGFIPRFTLGMILGYMFAYSGSLWPSVVAHFLNNLLTLLAIHFHWNEGGYEFLAEDYQFPVYLVVISTLLTVGIIYTMYLKRNKPIDFAYAE
jgi:membrane protease YdiL (CAAX protease family)